MQLPKLRPTPLFLVGFAFLTGFALSDSSILGALYGPAAVAEVVGLWFAGSVAVLFFAQPPVQPIDVGPPAGAC